MARSNKKKGKFRLVDIVLLIVCTAFFLTAAWKLYGIYQNYKEGRDTYQQIEEDVVIQNPDQKQNPDKGCPISIDFSALQKKNPDVIGWIYMEGITSISYPIMQGEDNEFYLHHMTNRAYNFAGSIFMNAENQKDFSDCNTIIYGHNMKDNSMFGALDEYIRNKAYKRSPYFWILTPKGNYRYEIFAVHTVKADGDAYTLFSEGGKEFVRWCHVQWEETEIPTRYNLIFREESKVVTLSTCTGNSKTRNVVQGVLQAE